MGRKKTLANRNNIILDAAEQLFSATSYEKTTLDEIAQQAGISKGSIYLEFANKEEILYSLFERNKEVELTDMRRIATQQNGSALDTLKEILLHNTSAIFDSMQQKKLSMEELQRSRKHLYCKLQPFIEARLGLIEELLARAEQQREAKQLPNRRRTAELLMHSLRAVRPPYDDEISKAALQQDAAEILDIMMNGLRYHG